MKLPEGEWMLFGMGGRRKLLYKAGALSDALTGEKLHTWNVRSTKYEPSEYRVTLMLAEGKTVRIEEDTKGVWIAQGSHRESVTASPVHLPRFSGPNAPVLRRLHQEILINIVDGKPLPNLWVYSKPWYRDGAMMLMCLEHTKNLHVAREWVMSLREPFDRNNAGHTEPDNLGQALYLISLYSDRTHPFVQTVLDTLPQFENSHNGITYIEGMSDFASHPVYQTKWLKYGLRSLHLPDKYSIPHVVDRYSWLFWMDYKDRHTKGPGFKMDENYPYLSWAETHFRQAAPPAPVDLSQPALSWEAHASQADYGKMAALGEEYVTRKLCVPHTWHAAEMFLYYYLKSDPVKPGTGNKPD